MTGLAGLATFLAIVLHKPFDAGIIATLMIGSGLSKKARLGTERTLCSCSPYGCRCLSSWNQPIWRLPIITYRCRPCFGSGCISMHRCCRLAA
jgi:hypothetical protein